MPSIASFSKILGLVICCQWVVFCSSHKDGGVIIDVPPPDALLARSSGHTGPISCGAEHRLAETIGLSRTRSAYLLSDLDPDRPAPLARSLSVGGATILPPPGLSSGTGKRRPSSVAVVSIAVISAPGELPVLHESSPAGISPAAPHSLALSMPEMPGNETDDSTLSSPIKPIALSIPSGEVLRPEGLLRFAVHIDAITAGNIKALFQALLIAINEEEGAIDVLVSNIETSCRETLNLGFKWGTITTREVAVDGFEYLSLAKQLVHYINVPGLALEKYIELKPGTKLEDFKAKLNEAIESSQSMLEKIGAHNARLETLRTLCPSLPARPMSFFAAGGEP
jgi:hypothetical protein